MAKRSEQPKPAADAPTTGRGLIYVGAGAYVPGVPACDLTPEMIAASGRTEDELVAYASGGVAVYRRVGETE